ncbi:MAG: hypothetical protein LBT79_02695 [Elusimicrobiota bacterium]|nr:hypothetical protein [Elusimicrobiota bacterium]
MNASYYILLFINVANFIKIIAENQFICCNDVKRIAVAGLTRNLLNLRAYYNDGGEIAGQAHNDDYAKIDIAQDKKTPARKPHSKIRR